MATIKINHYYTRDDGVEASASGTYTIPDTVGTIFTIPGAVIPLDIVGIEVVARNTWPNQERPYEEGYELKYRLLRLDPASPSAYTYSYVQVCRKSVLEYYEYGVVISREEEVDCSQVSNTPIQFVFMGDFDHTNKDSADDDKYSRLTFSDVVINLYTRQRRFSLTFDPNGGVGGETVRLYEGQSYTNRAQQIPVLANHEWMGWTYNLAAGTVDFARRPNGAGANIIEFGPMPARNVTLYAVWRQYTYLPLTQNGVIIRSQTDSLILRDGDG